MWFGWFHILYSNISYFPWYFNHSFRQNSTSLVSQSWLHPSVICGRQCVFHIFLLVLKFLLEIFYSCTQGTRETNISTQEDASCSQDPIIPSLTFKQWFYKRKNSNTWPEPYLMQASILLLTMWFPFECWTIKFITNITFCRLYFSVSGQCDGDYTGYWNTKISSIYKQVYSRLLLLRITLIYKLPLTYIPNAFLKGKSILRWRQISHSSVDSITCRFVSNQIHAYSSIRMVC